jgi:hypothetical protein
LTGSADPGTADDPQPTGASAVVHKPGRESGDPKELLLGFLDYYRSVTIRKIVFCVRRPRDQPGALYRDDLPGGILKMRPGGRRHGAARDDGRGGEATGV